MTAGDKAFWSDVADTIAPPYVRLVQQAAQSLANATPVAITFGTGSEEYDTHNFHDMVTNPSRITPSIPGVYEMTGTVSLVSAPYTQAYVRARLNGANVSPWVITPTPSAAGTGPLALQITVRIPCNGTTDFIELFAQQTSGAARNTDASAGFASVLEVVRLRPL